jgi:hypothetical protein
MEVNSSQSSASLVAIAVDVWSKESSSCTSSNSVTRLSTDRFSLVVSVNENTLNILRYSLCSWMSEMDPLDVILISDLPRHRLGGSAEVYLTISFALFSLSLSLSRAYSYFLSFVSCYFDIFTLLFHQNKHIYIYSNLS